MKLIALIGVIIFFVGNFCLLNGQHEPEMMEDRFVFMPLPEFFAIFGDYNPEHSILYEELQSHEDVIRVDRQPAKSAFIAGVLSVNIHVALRANNITLVDFLVSRINEIIENKNIENNTMSRMYDMSIEASFDRWQDALNILQRFVNEFQYDLNNNQEYESLAMFQAGVWLEMINLFADYMKLDYNPDKTTSLIRINSISNVSHNIRHMYDHSIITESFFPVFADRFRPLERRFLNIDRRGRGIILDNELNELQNIAQQIIRIVVQL